MKINWLGMVAVAVCLAVPVKAQDAPAPAQDQAAPAQTGTATFLIAANSSSGTYAEMLTQIISMCSSPANAEIGLTITPIKNEGGAVGNLEALAGNKAQAAFMHSDVIAAAAIFDKTYAQKYRTLLALYGEEIHIIALRDSATKKGGFLGVGGTTVEFNSLADLDGYKVGAAGGGTRTMQILIGQGQAKFEAVNYNTGAELVPALDKGDVQAIIFVGGAPLKNVAALDGAKYKLLRIDDVYTARLKDVYQPMTLSYTNLQANQVSTLAPVATLVTRIYKTPKFVQAQVKFRNCFYDHLDEMKETPDLHPKWQEVEAWSRGKWTWLDLPGDQPPPPASSDAEPQ